MIKDYSNITAILENKEFGFGCLLILTLRDVIEYNLSLAYVANCLREMGYSAKFEKRKTRLIVSKRISYLTGQ